MSEGIAIFEEHKIRRIYNEKTEMVTICHRLKTEAGEPVIKCNRLNMKNIELVTNCHQLKMMIDNYLPSPKSQKLDKK